MKTFIKYNEIKFGVSNTKQVTTIFVNVIQEAKIRKTKLGNWKTLSWITTSTLLYL